MTPHNDRVDIDLVRDLYYGPTKKKYTCPCILYILHISTRMTSWIIMQIKAEYAINYIPQSCGNSRK